MAGAVRQLQLLLTVQEIEPAIWRRVLVNSRATLSTLHKAIQVLMGWYDYHLHQFLVGQTKFAPPDDEDEYWDYEARSTRVAIGSVLREVGSTLVYEYDFGDDWLVDVVVEAVLPVVGRIPRIVCIAGDQAGPVEDSGGPHGYMELCRILADHAHPDHAEMAEWVPVGFSPDKLDLDDINGYLADI